MEKKKAQKKRFAETMSNLVSSTGTLSDVNLDASKIFFTSDIHFYHINIIEYCKRPFNSVHEMNEEIIQRWNQRVPHDGIVFIIGDVALGGKGSSIGLANILSRLNGRLFLIPGNHDDYIFDSPECLKHIEVLSPLIEIKVKDPEAERGSQRITMCHFAMKVWNKSHQGAWMLYGHSHHTMPPDYDIKSFDVGIDGYGYGYAPISYDYVRNLMEAHGQGAVDHHDKDTH